MNTDKIEETELDYSLDSEIQLLEDVIIRPNDENDEIIYNHEVEE